jgi:ABC-type Fe3+/spermidine/putrescine transport system ATPase subunit
MLDEPLGALDRALREQLLHELRLLLHQTGIPAIYVTHDQEEAFSLADRLILLHEGLVEQDGPPAEVVAHPASPWAARFLGLGNLVAGTVRRVEPLAVETPMGIFPARLVGKAQPAAGQPATLLLRPTAVRMSPPGSPIQGRIVDVLFQGEEYRVELECAGGIRLRFSLPQAPSVGDALTLYAPDGAMDCLIERDVP